MNNNSKLPSQFYNFFWDVNANQIDTIKRSKYVIERLLEYGDLHAFNWLKNAYELNIISDVVINSKLLSQKSANFYSLIFSIPQDKILCLQKDFRSKHKKIWKY